MNILFYCSEYPPYPAGGIGSVTKIVAEALARRGHNIFVVGFYHDMHHLPLFSVVNGVSVYRLSTRFSNALIYRYLYKVMAKLRLNRCLIQKQLDYTEKFIAQLILQKKIDILEMTDYYPFNAQAGKLRFHQFPIPTVLRIHGCASFVQELKGYKKISTYHNDQCHFERCHYISAVSEFSMHYVEDNFDISYIKKEVIIYNPVEAEFFNSSPVSTIDNHTILFIGKLTESKGCYSLLKAFNICASQYPNLRLRLAGNGDVKTAEALINPVYRDRVKFLGYCDRGSLKNEIDNCSFACIPSYFESFGMVALEVMARQKALIFTERTSGKEIIDDGIDGYTVNPENIEQIADRMRILLSDTGLREQMAKKGYVKALNKFSIVRVIEEIESFYTSLVR